LQPELARTKGTSRLSSVSAWSGYSDRLRPASVLRRWRWAALPLGALYLILLAVQFGSVIRSEYLNADVASALVIAQDFGRVPAHGTVLLADVGWYWSLILELATKWLPAHRQVWEATPYVLALVAAGLVGWSVLQVAGRWAAGLATVLLICASPPMLFLSLSPTHHAPDVFCVVVLGAFAVFLEQRGAHLRWVALAALALIVGITVGVDAASAPLVTIAGLVPFGGALLASHILVLERRHGPALWTGLATLAVACMSWVITVRVMSGLSVITTPGSNPTMLATGDKISQNFSLWWQSIAVLGNGDFFGRNLSAGSALAVACAALSIGAIVVLPRVGWRELRVGIDGTANPVRLAFMTFWCSSAVLLTLAFLVSTMPVNILSYRYLGALLYAGYAVIPAIAAGRWRIEAAVLAGTCVLALGGVISMAKGTVIRDGEAVLPVTAASQVARIAAREHVTTGYAGYWDAAPFTWATRFRVQVYPVWTCGGTDAHLCRFTVANISSWYWARPRTRSFLLTDPALPYVPQPTPDLGRPTAVYHIGRITMYIYQYDLASKIVG
jgi:hypothetical protein